MAIGAGVVLLVSTGERMIAALAALGTALATWIGLLRVARAAVSRLRVLDWPGREGPARQPLPPGAADGLTGRDRELGTIRALADQLLGQREATTIVLLWGMGGAGKTTLACAIAREYVKDFRNVDLWDMDWSGSGERRASDALAHLLLVVAGLPAERLPEGQPGHGRDDHRAALWQRWASAHSTLLVLENISTFSEVERLIPSEGRHLILITARHKRLGHLPGYRYHSIPLDGLAPPDAHALFEKEAGRPLSGEERRQVEILVRRADGLPLAICLLAAILRDGTSTVADLLAEVRAEGALAVVDDRCRGQVTVSDAASLAFRRLSPSAQRVFCLLAQHPLGCGIDVDAARALTGISQVHKHLRELCEAALLRPDAGNGPPPQYKMHQLLREYASGLVPGTITSAEADSAAERLFRHYWRTAEELVALAEPYLSRHTRPGAAPASAAAPGLVSSAPQATVRWFKAQRELLLACIDQAADRHLDHWVVCLTSVMAGFLRNNGPWDQAIDRHAAAAHAAARLGDRVAQGVALNHLAITCRLAGRYDQALTVLPQVHAIFTGPLPADVPARDIWLGQANALNEQGIVHNEQGDHDAATLALRAALSLYQKADDHIGMANSNKNLGVALFHAGLGSYDTSVCAEALQRLSDAMAGYAAINDELGLAEVANHRGRLHLHTGDISDAMADFQHALRMVRETASLVEEARAKEGIGSCYLATGARDQARPYLDAAGHIYTEIRAQGRAGRADTSSARL